MNKKQIFEASRETITDKNGMVIPKYKNFEDFEMQNKPFQTSLISEKEEGVMVQVSNGDTQFLTLDEYKHFNKKNILIFGGGNQASYVIDIIHKQGLYNIVGIIDSVKEIGSKVFGYEVLGRMNDLESICKENNVYGGVIAIGDNYSRDLVFSQILDSNYVIKFVNAIHPSVIIGENVQIGEGVVAMAGVIFNTNAKIGNFTFFATGCQIEHDCELGDFASVSAGTVLGGHVKIGCFSALTLNVTVLDRLNIGSNTVVGAGSLVLKDLTDNVLAYGNPCKVIRSRELGEKFLK